MNIHPLLDALLRECAALNASDLHLIAGLPAAMRVNGDIQFTGKDALTSEVLTVIAHGLMNPLQREKFDREWELCISILHPTAGRLRATFYLRNGLTEMSMRLCGSRIFTQTELGLPLKIDELARRRNGLILICGPTGAGKTTTLNYLVNLLNMERRCKIVTIEDPIEYVHGNNKAIVVQQEVLTDTHSFSRALVHVLRQDPDVIVVGEMRNPEDIFTALTAAETGHLVLSTLHSSSAVQCLERIISVFDGPSQKQVILQLANNLQGILVQELLPSADRKSRVLAYEMLCVNSAVRAHIREHEIFKIESCIQTGAKDGMITMDTCLTELYRRCAITYDTMMSRARYPQLLPIHKA